MKISTRLLGALALAAPLHAGDGIVPVLQAKLVPSTGRSLLTVPDLAGVSS